jgi:P4 family phage/plasmid primase-like protien
MTTSKSINLSKFLQEHKAVDDNIRTHTRIGDKEKDIYGGAYHIPDSEWENFMQLYYQTVIVKGQLEYLTEKQLVENGPIMIDIDFRYDSSVKTKQHKPEHIEDALVEYMEQIEKLMDITDGAVIEVFVMEKNDVNQLPDKTKDGIHIIIGVQMHKALQAMLRTSMIPILKDRWDDLPVKNDWQDILDEGVTKGICNWQIYGSRKPGNQAYMIKNHYKFNYSAAAREGATGDWSYSEEPLAKFSTEKNILKLSARYTEYPGYPMKQHVYEAFELSKKNLSKKETTTTNHNTLGGNNARKVISASASTISSYGDIKDEATLDAELARIMDKDTIDASDYKLKEAHDYTMILPVSYYGPGSYNKWIKVGMALRNESPKLFLTWLKFSCQDNCRDTLKGANGKFDWTCVPEIFQTWEKFTTNRQNPLTYKSIMYWAKNENREKFDAIWTETTAFYVNQSIQGGGTDDDLAVVLYSMKKDRFVCTAIKNKVWYEYINHRWHEIDSGNTLRMAISKDMHKIYNDMLRDTYDKVQIMDPNDTKRESVMKSIKVIGAIAFNLKKTQPKENIMKEARDRFYDSRFLESLDNNTHLLCFNNGVIDFKLKLFRKGNPEDGLSKCTNIDYIPYQTVLKKHMHTMNEILDFMHKVFPIKDVEEYMWDHLASCLIGINLNQTFNVYKGVGANGKITELMMKSLGTYYKTINVTLLTTKPASIGSATSELAQTPGVRYLVMNEPNKGDKLVEGTMKQFSGGDEIQARQLFKESYTFTPQFKMAMLTNNDLDIGSNDDGTWRRLRYVDFISLFLTKPYEDDRYTREEHPYQYPIDEKLGEKLGEWAPVFMSMLVERVYKTDGYVKDCPTVLNASKKKREENDYLAAFVKDNVRRKEGKHLKKTELLESFKLWYLENNPGSKNIPKGKEIVDYMNLKFGELSKIGWRNTEIVEEKGEEDD